MSRRVQVVNPGSRIVGFGADTDTHGCTPDQVYNETAGACVSLDQNLAIINAGVSAAGAQAAPSKPMADGQTMFTPTNVAIGAAVLAIIYGFTARRRR